VQCETEVLLTVLGRLSKSEART